MLARYCPIGKPRGIAGLRGTMKEKTKQQLRTRHTECGPTMLTAFSNLQLSSLDNDQLRGRAREAMGAAYRIREADNEKEMTRRAHLVRETIDDMIGVARDGEPGDP
jgi:hypothetical protein